MGTMFDNLRAQLPIVLLAINWMAYVLGVIFILLAVISFIKKSAGHPEPLAKGVGALLIGGVLMANEQWILAVLSSLTDISVDHFASAGHPVLTYMERVRVTDQPFTKMMKTVLGVVQFFGYVAVLRGLLLFKRATDGTASHGATDAVVSGFHHTLFGVLAINIKYLLVGSATLFGFPVPAFVM